METMDFTNYLTAIEKEIDSVVPLASTPGLEQGKWTELSFGKKAGEKSALDCLAPSHVAPLLEPTRNLVDLGGKRWRPLLLVLCAQAQAFHDKKDVSLIEAQAYHISPLVECIHTASLIHDDIEDSSDMRRGKPAAYITYGLDTALNAGSWLYFQAPTCIDSLDADEGTKLRLYSLYAKETRRLHLGQAMDIAWHRDISCVPGTEEYLAMVQCKTGTLASLAAKAGTSLATGDMQTVTKAGEIAAKIGAGFQIIDDVINLTFGNPGKRRGDDIVEGKKSLPVLLFLHKKGSGSDDANLLRECFAKARDAGSVEADPQSVEKAISLLTDAGAVDEAKQKGRNLIEEGCEDFVRLYGTSEYSERITALFDAMIPKNLFGKGL